jgi:hypothetical protein
VSENSNNRSIGRAGSQREKPFIVQSPKFRCMAYRDASGKWWDYFNGDEIEGEVTVVVEG